MSKDLIIYHNPRCSKSRETLALLEQQGIEPEVIEYLKTPPSSTTLTAIVKALGLPAKSLVRTKEEGFKKIKLDLDDDAAVVKTLAKHPELLERPIVVNGKKAVIGRPPENVLKIL